MATNSTNTVLGTDDIVIGVMYTITSVVEFVLYIPCLIVIRTDPEFAEHSCFRMMFSLGISDLITLVAEMLTGIVTFTGGGNFVPFWLNKYFGAFLHGFGWYTYTIQCHVIAINRFATVGFLTEYWKEWLFSPKKTTIWIAFCWLYGALWWILETSPLAGFVYITPIYTWYFDAKAEWFHMAKTAGWYSNLFNLNMNAIWYLIILGRMWHFAKMTSQAVASTERRRERRILKQMAIICLYTLVWDQYWHFGGYLYTDKGFKYAFVIGNMFWIFNAGINPVVYLAINKRIRKKVMTLLHLNNEVANSTSNLTRSRQPKKAWTTGNSKPNEDQAGDIELK